MDGGASRSSHPRSRRGFKGLWLWDRREESDVAIHRRLYRLLRKREVGWVCWVGAHEIAQLAMRNSHRAATTMAMVAPATMAVRMSLGSIGVGSALRAWLRRRDSRQALCQASEGYFWVTPKSFLAVYGSECEPVA